MNVLQKIILAGGIVVLGILVMFPHWTLAHPTQPNLLADGGHRFVFSPPRGIMVPHVNIIELAIFGGMIVGLTIVAYWLTRDRE